MATNPTKIRAARPTTTMAGRMLKPAYGAGRAGGGPAPGVGAAPSSSGPSASVIFQLPRPPAYDDADHPKWSMGPCPAPSVHEAPPTSPRATNAVARLMAVGPSVLRDML